MRRKKGRIPRRDRLESGRWHRDTWFSVAYAGPWSLRAHHKRAGWRAHVRHGSRRLWDLPAPVATRCDAENAILEAAEGLCAGVKAALDGLRRQASPDTIRSCDDGETVAVTGAHGGLAEIRAALETLRGDSAARRSEPARAPGGS